MATLLDVLTDTRSHLDEATATYWGDDELKVWIAEAMRDIARRAEVLADTFAYDVINGKEAYDLPPDMLRIHRVEYRQTTDNTWALEFRPILEMDDLWLRSRTSTGTPAWWTIWGFAGGSQQLRLYPIPSENISDGLILYYYRLPRKPSDNNDPIDLPAGWEDLIPLYVSVNAFLKDKDFRWRDTKALYEQRLAEMIQVTRHPTDQQTFISASGMFGSYSDWNF